MTVKEAFGKAFGPVPIDATCHIACLRMSEVSFDEEGIQHRAPCWELCYSTTEERHVPLNMLGNAWNTRSLTGPPLGPDISDRPAESFRGFFGPKYDAVLPEGGEAGLEPPASPFRDGATHEDFWDCDCEPDYIHRKSDATACFKCGCVVSESPDSHLAELVNAEFLSLEDAIEYARARGLLREVI